MSKHEEDVELKSKELQDLKVCRLSFISNEY